MSELRHVYEAGIGRAFEPNNFRRIALGWGVLAEDGERADRRPAGHPLPVRRAAPADPGRERPLPAGDVTPAAPTELLDRPSTS